MATAPLAADREGNAIGPASPRPEWLGGPGAIAALTEQAAALERDWVFGWLLPAANASRTDLARALPGKGAMLVGGVGRNEISYFAVDDGGGLRFVGSVEAKAGVLTNGGEHLYALTAEQLLGFARDADTGELAATGFAVPPGVTCCGRRAMAVTDDDAHLFVLERSGEVVGLFSLDDPLRPARLPSFSRFPEATITPYLSCGFAAARRHRRRRVCPSLVVTVARDAATGVLDLTDHARGGQTDRFNAAVPDFGRATGFAASPDDRTCT